MNKLAQPKRKGEVSPLLMTCLLFLVHSFTNSLFLSPLGSGVRCIFWDQRTCSKDEAWIADWFAFSHCHVALLVSGIAHASHGNPKLEATLSYLVSGIIFIYMAEGIFSINLLNAHLVNVQVVIFVLLLISIAFSTAEQERNQPLIPLPRKLSTSSFQRRGKLSIANIAIGFQFLGSMLRVIEMVLGGTHQTGYKGDQSSAVYQSISSMALCDMMIAAGLLGASIRFFESDQHKIILWYHVAALLVSQAMLAGDVGEMIGAEEKRAGSVGNFISLVAATMGAL